MNEKKVTARARAQLTVEIETGGLYGEDWTTGSIYKEAERTAREVLTRRLIESEKTAMDESRFFIIGEPIVSTIILERR